MSQLFPNIADDGYFISRGLLTDKDVDPVRREAINIFDIQIKRFGIDTGNFETDLFQLFKEQPQIVINCGKHIQQTINLYELCINEKILWLLNLDFTTIATKPVLFFHNKNLAKEDIYYKIPAHRDFPSIQGSLDSLVAWVPLVDVNKDLGALQIVPKSHKLDIKTSKHDHNFALVDGFQDSDFMDVELNKGDALFFSTLLVHRSGNNITDKIRWSCNFRYSNMLEPDFIERGFPNPYIYKSTATEDK